MTERKTHIDALGAGLLVAIMVSLGLNQVAVKLVNEAMAPIFQAGMRSLAAAPIVWLYCQYQGTKIDVSRAILLPGIATGLAFAFEFALLFQALEYTTVARASVFFYTMPFWVALGAHFLIPNERLTPIRVAGLILAAIGVVVAMSNRNLEAGANTFLGDVMALAAATGWASIALIARTTAFSTIKPELQLLYQVVISAPILIGLAIATGDTFNEPQTWHWIVFAGQVLLIVCLGFLVWFWILSVYPASDMASFSFLAPLFGVFFGWLILGEALTWTIVFALIFVALGILLVNRR